MSNQYKEINYGRKKLYFSNFDKVQKFINLYEDLFVRTSWAKDKVFNCAQVETDKGVFYELVFLMDHDEFRKIEKDLKIRRRKVVRRYEYWPDENRSIRFVG